MQVTINNLNRYNIIKSNKDFLLFDIDINSNLKYFKCTNDLQRYKNKYTYFRVLSCIKNELNKQIINI
jgi:hypothetical protein